MTLLYRFCRDGTRIFFKLYGRCRIIGREKIPRTGPVIFASNHVSYLDPPLVGSAALRECAFIGRHDLWNNRRFGWLITRLNAIPVQRNRPDRAVFRHALEALDRGLGLVLFPEGGRSEDGVLQSGEPGVALIVQKSGAPVVPCAVIGPEKMLPVGQKKLRRTPLTVVFGDPLTFAPDCGREQIVGTIMRAIAALLTEHGRPMVAQESQGRGKSNGP